MSRSNPTTRYHGVVESARSEMTPFIRQLCRIVDAPVIRHFIQVLALIFPPRAALFASCMSSVLLIVAFAFSLLYQTSLVGSEPLLGFIFGYIIGILYDVFASANGH